MRRVLGAKLEKISKKDTWLIIRQNTHHINISMNHIPFTRFFLFAEAVHLAIAVPALCVILLLRLLEMRAALVIFTIFLLSSPIASWLSWLMAKGSNWVNTAASMKAVGGVTGQLYGALVGGLLGEHFFGTVGGIVMLVLFFGSGMFAGSALGGMVAKKLTAGPQGDKSPIVG
jgi:hypothetical protein